MPRPFRFMRFRVILLTLGLLAQGYLFVRFRQTIRALPRDRFLRRLFWPAVIVLGLFFALNAYLLFQPVSWADPPSLVQVFLLYPSAVWTFGAIFSALFLLMAQLLGTIPRAVLRSVPTDRLSRRRFLQAGAAGLVTAPLAVSAYGAVVASRKVRLEEIRLPLGVPLRMVQLTDIHAGLYMNREEMRGYADRVNALQPDLFVLTGDYISNSVAFLPECLEEMARVKARYGTFATYGNHEHWFTDIGQVRPVFERIGIPILNNAHRVIRTDRGAFVLAGIDDLASGFPDLDRALEGRDPTLPVILLSHHPEIFPDAARHGIQLTLSGHWHGGQIVLRLPGRNLSLAHMRTPYPEGLFRINASHLYVSRGIGTTFTPVRLNAPPEITLFQLT
ncbi:MAG TPA: metallophosphoesterase [Candidatus Baltobacteraceae bacterium]|nr:metallophosphoesterase [Candidatus Baltobacteraceae bacterium]